MNKAEELREIFNDLPQDESERLMEQFMHHARKVLQKSRMYDDLSNKRVLGIVIPYRAKRIRFDEMYMFNEKEEFNENIKILRFSPNMKYPEPNEDTKKECFCSVKTGTIDKNAKEFILSTKLVEEGFRVNYRFLNAGIWLLASVDVFFEI